MSTTKPSPTVATPSGYATHDEYWATKLTQGGRTVYSIDLSIPQVVTTIPRPDPAVPLEGNRRITPSRSKRFAEYVRQHDRYVCPPLLVRAPMGEFDFKDANQVAGGTTFGVLAVPKLARQAIRIIDGQHRVLGFHVLWDEIEADLQKFREQKAQAKRMGDRDTEKHFERRANDVIKERDRLAQERVRIDIVIVDDPKDFKQVFVDIADNQKGISGAVKARFDNTQVVNRALDDVLRHPLLVGRVNEESDTIHKSSPFLLGANHVAQIIRALQVGATGRVSKRQEAELQDATVVREAMSFLDLLVDAFPGFSDVQDGSMDPSELRSKSVLGSATMLRTLAGVHFNLTRDHIGWTRDEVKNFFELLEPHLKAPVDPKGLLMGTGAFKDGAMAPTARQGDITSLQTQLVEWATSGRLK